MTHTPRNSYTRPREMPGTRRQYRAPVDERAIGKRLRELRVQRGMTQSDVADELRINQSSVSDYEKGVVRMHAALVAGFARVFKVTTDQLLGLEKPAANGHLKDRRFLRRLERIDKLSKRDRQLLLGTIAMPSSRNCPASTGDAPRPGTSCTAETQSHTHATTPDVALVLDGGPSRRLVRRRAERG